MADVSDNSLYKSIWFCLLIAFLGILFFAYKVNACAEKPPTPTYCHDEWIPADDRSVQCSPGAVGTLTTNPKVGIMCHCVSNFDPDAGKP